MLQSNSSDVSDRTTHDSIFPLISERYLESQSYIAPVFADRV